MSLKKFLCLTMMIVLLCATLPAQSMRLSPDEAVDLALKANLSLESSRAGLSSKERASKMSWNQFVPSITVAGSYSRDNFESKGTSFSLGIPGVPPITMPGSPQTRVSIPVSVQLNLNAAMFENMKRLRIDYESGLIAYDKAKLQLERDVRKAYHNMLLLQENIELLRLSYENVERQVEMAQANYNAGLVPELTYLQARVSLQNMQPMIDQAENGLKLSMAQFAMFLGLDYNTPFELIPIDTDIEFIPLDVAQMISKAASQKPDIMELRQQILMLESARKAQVLALTPSLSVGWNMAPTYMGDPMKDWVDPIPGALSITLALQLHSLFPFSANFQGIKAMDDQIKTANIGLRQLINGTEIEIYNTVLSLEKARVTAEAQAETVALAEQSFQLTEQAYQAGLQDYFQVQNAQQSLHQARVQMLEQQFNYLNGLLDLEYSIGVPFGTLVKSNVSKEKN